MKVPTNGTVFLQGAETAIKSDANLDLAWSEIRAVFELISASAIKRWFELNATTGMKSVSTCITKMTMQAFESHGWERDWTIFRAATGASETLSFVKTFGKAVIALEIGSRHRQQLLSTYLKANLAVSRSEQPGRREIDCYFIGAYPEHTLSWGRWNGAVSSFEDYETMAAVVDGALAHPTVVFAIEHPRNLVIETNLSGTLALSVV